MVKWVGCFLGNQALLYKVEECKKLARISDINVLNLEWGGLFEN